MQSVSRDNFGPLIAYLVPGFTVLIGLSILIPSLQKQLSGSALTEPTIGGFLYMTVSSIAMGMTVSAFRWATVDKLHHLSGVQLPHLDFGKIRDCVPAILLLIEIHYRHYLFYANMLVATSFVYGCYRVHLASLSIHWIDVGFPLLATVFFLASRDTLQKYYTRLSQLLKSQSLVMLP